MHLGSSMLIVVASVGWLACDHGSLNGHSAGSTATSSGGAGGASSTGVIASGGTAGAIVVVGGGATATPTGGTAGSSVIASGGTGGIAVESSGGSAGTSAEGKSCGGAYLGQCPGGFQCVHMPSDTPGAPGICQSVVPDGGVADCMLPMGSFPCADDNSCGAEGAACDKVSHTCVCISPACEVGADRTCNDDSTLSATLGVCGAGRNCFCADGMVKNSRTGKCAVGTASSGIDPCAKGACDGKVTVCFGINIGNGCRLVTPDCATTPTCVCACPSITDGYCGAGTTGCVCSESSTGPVVTCNGA